MIERQDSKQGVAAQSREPTQGPKGSVTPSQYLAGVKWVIYINCYIRVYMHNCGSIMRLLSITTQYETLNLIILFHINAFTEVLYKIKFSTTLNLT